jgi:hypothetical protein
MDTICNNKGNFVVFVDYCTSFLGKIGMRIYNLKNICFLAMFFC